MADVDGLGERIARALYAWDYAPSPPPWGEIVDARRDRYRGRADAVLAEIGDIERELAQLREAARALYEELKRWGWGDMHYGNNMPQDPRVVAALQANRDD